VKRYAELIGNYKKLEIKNFNDNKNENQYYGVLQLIRKKAVEEQYRNQME
jgi:hypothetical protein